MKKAVLYLRMSTDKQEYSIESQRRVIEDYAIKNKYEILKEYVDYGVSGREAEKRQSFMQMIEDSKKGEFYYVLIYDSSRFARNLEQSLVYKSMLRKNGVSLISVTEPSLDDDSQLIADALFGAMNEMYSRKLSKVVKRGMMEKALLGEYISCAPYGYYKPKNKPLVIVEEEAKVVRRIFAEFLSGKSTYAIAKMLNSEDIKTKKGNSIDTRWVKKIITNMTYKGYYCFNSDGKQIIKKAKHIPIIDEEDFEKAKNIFENSEKRKKQRQKPLEYNKHWLCGLIRCAECGQTYVYAKYYNNRQDRFRCGGYTCGKCTNHFSIGVNDMENIVLSKISDIYPNYIKKVELKNIDNYNKEKDIKEIEKYKKALEKAKKAYLMEIDTIEEYAKNKKEISQKIEFLEKRIENNKEEKNTIKEISILEVLNSNESMELKNKMARLVIHGIEVDKEKKQISIYFNA